MTGLNEILEQARLFAEQHVPPEVFSQAVPAAIAVVAVGVLISVLGARLVRPVVTLAFALVGAAAAWRLSQHLAPPWPANIPAPVAITLGGLVAGLFGYALHRLWVGLLIAAVSASIALSAFGYYRILPEIPAYQELSNPTLADNDRTEFVLLDAADQAQYAQRDPQTWAKDFWAHLTARHADIGGKTAVVGAGAALVGLLLGLLATRGALILCTALVGTLSVLAGVSVVVARMAPEVHSSALQHPRLIAASWAGLLVCSLVLQGLLNRRPPAHPTLESAR